MNLRNQQYFKRGFLPECVEGKAVYKDGDIFQVVLSQRLCVETNENPFNIYRALRVINPSPYMYYLKFGGYRIIGSSPEMLVRVENGMWKPVRLQEREREAGQKKRMRLWKKSSFR